MYEYQNTKTFLLKGICLIGVKRYLLLKMLKILFCGLTLLMNLNSEEIIGTFYEKELQKTNQEEFRIEVTKGN